jgi:diguanylate cyclase (GGDEF)-like protein
MRALKGAFGVKLASILFLLAFFVLLAFDLMRDQAQREADTEQRMAAASQHLASRLEDTLRDIDLVFDALDDNPLVRERLSEQPTSTRERELLRNFLDNSIERITYLAQIRIVDYHCNTVFSTPVDSGPPLPAEICAWMREEGRRSDIFFTASAADGAAGEMLRATRLVDARHAVIGMAVAALSESTLQPLFSNVANVNSGEVLVFDRDRHLAMFWPPSPVPGKQPSAMSSRRLLWQEDKQQIYRYASMRDRIARLYSERELDNYPLTVAVGQSEHRDVSEFLWQLLSYASAWIVLALLVRWATRQRLHHLRINEQLFQCSEALHESELRWRTMLNAIPLGVLLVDTESERIHFANPAARAILQWGQPDEGMAADELASHSPRFQLHPIIEWLRQGHWAQEQDVEIERDAQTPLWVQVNMHNLHIDGRTLCMITLSDRSPYYLMANHLADCQRQLDAMARTDMLTRLANRKAAESSLSTEMNRCRRYDLPLTLACFNIDHFRAFNERYGRNAGDNVLIAVANTLIDNTRTTDICARLSGEEFLVAFTNTSQEYAGQVMERIRAKIASTIFPFAEQSVTFSGGITCWHMDDTVETLIRRAQNLMEQAKQQGRNRLLSDEQTS